MSAENVKVIESVYAAMKQGDIPAMFALLAPDIQIWQSDELPWGGSFQGLDQAKIFFGKVNTYLSPSVAIERFIDSGDFVVVIGRTQGTIKQSSHPFDVPLIHLWEVRAGKIAGLRVYLENATMQSALASACYQND